jgi:hypothetical protein
MMRIVASGFWADNKLKIWNEHLEIFPETAQLALLLRLTLHITQIYIDVFYRGTVPIIDLISL